MFIQAFNYSFWFKHLKINPLHILFFSHTYITTNGNYTYINCVLNALPANCCSLFCCSFVLYANLSLMVATQQMNVRAAIVVDKPKWETERLSPSLLAGLRQLQTITHLENRSYAMLTHTSTIRIEWCVCVCVCCVGKSGIKKKVQSSSLHQWSLTAIRYNEYAYRCIYEANDQLEYLPRSQMKRSKIPNHNNQMKLLREWIII